MKEILVRGGARLEGTIRVSGAKNSAIPKIIASLLSSEEVHLDNVPKIEDVGVTLDILRTIGTESDFSGNTLKLRSNRLSPETLLENPAVGRVRSSVLLTGALLPRCRHITMPLPGGCQIGDRKLDSIVEGLTSLGARVRIGKEQVQATLEKLRGSDVIFEYPSVSATINTMVLACLAKGRTTIRNVAKEPEIVDLSNFLNSMGAKISGAGTDVIKVEGVRELSGTRHSVIPDRIETGTYMVAAGLTKGEVLLENSNIRLLQSVAFKLRQAGLRIEESQGRVRVTASGRPRAVGIVTRVYPGFPTDMQPIAASLLSGAEGHSAIKDTVYPARFNYVKGLRQMGAQIEVAGNRALITGVNKLKGAEVEAPDIRSGAALLMAGLAAEGETRIRNAYQILRGYEEPLDKLKNIGAEVCLVDH